MTERNRHALSAETLDHPSRIAVKGKSDLEKRQSAEDALMKLVMRCRADVVRGLRVLNEHYTAIGKEMIVMDYLLWSKKYESYVSQEFYKLRTDEIRSCITDDERRAAANSPNPFTEEA